MATTDSTANKDVGGTSPEKMTADVNWEIMAARETFATDTHMFDIDKQSDTLGPIPGSSPTPAEETDGGVTTTNSGLL